MPPAGRPRPDEATYKRFAAWLEISLDQAAQARANPGRPQLHRLNRSEYANAIRDLLALDIDVDMTRMKTHLTQDQSRLQAQIECLLEEMRIKLSSVVSDLLGVSGLRILKALAAGQSDAHKLAGLGDERLHASQETLVDALSGRVEPYQRQLLGFYLQRYELLQSQIEQLQGMIAQAMQAHQQAVERLVQVPGFGPNSAQQVIAEVGVQASSFASPAQLASWVGTCPGKEESAEKNQSSRSAKGNRYLRRILNQVAHAAVKKQGSHFQLVFRRLLPRLGYKGAIWAVAHKICKLVWKILHDQVDDIEQGSEPNPKAKQQRARVLLRRLRQLGYQVTIQNRAPVQAES